MARLGSQMTDAWEAKQQGSLRVQTADARQGKRAHLREHLPFFMHLFNFWTIIFLYARGCEEAKPKPPSQGGEVFFFFFIWDYQRSCPREILSVIKWSSCLHCWIYQTGKKGVNTSNANISLASLHLLQWFHYLATYGGNWCRKSPEQTRL